MIQETTDVRSPTEADLHIAAPPTESDRAMLEVTDEARTAISQAVEETGVPLRLQDRKDGGLRLRPSTWESGDMSYAHAGKAILLVKGALAHALAHRSLDIKDADDVD